MQRAGILLSVAYAIGFSLIVATGSLVALSARSEQPVMAVFPPGTPLAETLDLVEAAGVRITGFGPVSWVVAVTPLDGAATAALRRQGAWLLLDAGRLTALCRPVVLAEQGVSA